MILELFLLAIGIVLLVAGADKFVDSGSKIAKKLGLSDFIIGLTLIAVGTSLPELASSTAASIKGSSELVVGNLIGSNIANIGLIVGICAMMAVIKTNVTMLKRDGYIMIFVSIIFFILAANRRIGIAEGFILLILYFIYVLFLIESKEVIKKRFHFQEFIVYFINLKFINTIIRFSKQKQKKDIDSRGIIKDIILCAISLSALILGAKLLVDNAIYFSKILNISETFIGLALVAVGTSLPELAVSISAIRKGFNEILIGNIIGSNIANITLIFGISSFFRPVTIAVSSLAILIPAMIAFSLLFLIFIRQEWKIRRIHGIILLSLYLLFIILFGVFS